MPYDVFLSHSSADKPAVEALAYRLRAQGIEPFLDKWHLVPGEPWQEALEKALDQSLTCAVFLGPEELGPWQNEEMRSALDDRVRNGDFRVIPVLLPGALKPGREEIPRFLRRLTWVDFRDGLDDEGAFHRLLSGIRGQAPGPGAAVPLARSYRSMAPPREAFVHRREYDLAVEALVSGAAGARGGAAGLFVGLRGAGGFGKTALAQAVCWDDRVLAAYPDGVLWTTMGEDVDPAGRLSRVRDLIRWWKNEDPPTFETVGAAGAHLREALKGRRVLLVVDDVWKPEDVTPLQGLEAGAALLVTTRDVRTLPAERTLIEIDAMASPEAVTLLGAELPEGQKAGLAALASRLGEWPLLLKIVNRQLRELVGEDGLTVEQALREIGEALDAEGLTVFDQGDAEGRHQAVARTLEVSFKRLSAEERTRYDELGIFPEDRDVPLSVLARLWGTSVFAAKKLCDRLHDLSLLLRFDRQTGTIRLHDVVRAYLIRTNQEKLPAVHKRLLDAFHPPSGRWSDLPRDEAYLWRHLANHLAGSGEGETIRELLLDFAFLQAKMEATDVNALLADYAPAAEKDPELRLVHETLRLSANVLAKSRQQLAGQLLGRIMNRTEPGVQRLLQGAWDWRGALWLRPKTATLTSPGGPLIRTLEGHTDGVSAVVRVDGHRVLSGSRDATLRLWDVETGETVRRFEGHLGWVTSVALLDSQRALSGAGDGTLRIWNLETGDSLRVLEGHSAGVNAVASWSGRWAVSASEDKTLRVWDLQSGEALRILKGHQDQVTAVAVLDGRRALSGSADTTLRLWDLQTGEMMGILEGHTGGVSSIVPLDPKRVLSASQDGTLRVWDLETRESLRTLGKPPDWLTAVDLLDGRRALTASLFGTLQLWDLETGEALQAIKNMHSEPTQGMVLLDGRRAVSISDDWTLRVWDLEAAGATPVSEFHPMVVVDVRILEPDRAVSMGYDKTLRIWDLETGKALRSLHPGIAGKAVAILPGSRVAFGLEDHTLSIQDLESGLPLLSLSGHRGPIEAVAVRGPYAATASSDRTLRLWELATGEAVRTFEGHADAVHDVAFLDDRHLISASSDATLRLWDLATGKPLRVFAGHTALIETVVPLDGGRAASGSADKTLRIWDLESGEARILEGYTGWVKDIAALDSRRMASASKDWTVKIWDLEAGRPLAAFCMDATPTSLAFSPDQQILVAGDDSGRVHILEIVDNPVTSA